jgi:hypothetical protein
MKKLMMIAVAGLFLFASCGNKTQEAAPAEEPQQKECQKGDSPCCKEMNPEQKADCEAWKNWDSQTAEKKQELITKRKECVHKMIVEREAKKAEMEAKMADYKAKLATWDKLTVDQQKALIEEFDALSCHKMQGDKPGCCKEEKEGCKHHQTEQK